MDLHPCRCGELDFEPRHSEQQRGDTVVATYEGECPNCGAARRFEFVVDAVPPPWPAYGGDEPSQIIDPGQFLWVAEQFAKSVPADPADLNADEDLDEAVEAMAVAVAAVEEVLKFIPDGADAVPESAFTAPEGWMVYQQEPGRFRRDRLETRLAAYRRGLAHYTG